MKLTRYKICLAALALVFVLAISAFFGLRFTAADAQGTTSATNVFRTTGSDVSIVGAMRSVLSEATSTGSEQKYFLTFKYENGDEDEDNYVYYSNKLAYSWYESVTEDEVTRVQSGMFHMEFGFDDLNFEKFVITFESQQYVRSEDGKTKNYLMFFPAGEDSVYVVATANRDLTLADVEEGDKKPLDKDHIRVDFVGYEKGAYNIRIYNYNGVNVLNYIPKSENVVEGKLENIGGTFSKSVTSGSTTVYPLIFEACFASDAAKDLVSGFVFYDLNGQNLASLTGNAVDKYYTLSNLTDNKPPVLCLTSDFCYFTQGTKVNFDYNVIDVLRTAASGKINYYVLTDVQAHAPAEFDYHNKDLFSEVGDNDILETDRDAYLPMERDLIGKVFNPVYNADGTKTDGKVPVDMLVKAYVEIYDTTSSTIQEKADVYLDWYVSEEYKVEINGEPFLAVASDGEGASFNYYGNDGKTWDELVAEYQTRVDEAAKDLTAGKTSYFYLPSLEDLFADSITPYKDLKVSVYYYNDTKTNNAGTATNNLAINVQTAGDYLFTVYATDAAGNNMHYFEDGEVKEFAEGEIWEMYDDRDKLHDLLPWFTFSVTPADLKFEEDEDNKSGLQPTGYVGTPYNSVSFELNSDKCDLSYRLFHFNREAYFRDNNKNLTYEEFIAIKDELFENAETRKYFNEIISMYDMESTDEEYEEFSPYEWYSDATAFTPQESGFYYVLASARDENYISDPVTSSIAVVISEEAKPFKGENDWLQKNLVSVILLSVAALVFVAIIVLLFVKPKQKEDIDIRLDKQKKANKPLKK